MVSYLLVAEKQVMLESVVFKVSDLCGIFTNLPLRLEFKLTYFFFLYRLILCVFFVVFLQYIITSTVLNRG